MKYIIIYGGSVLFVIHLIIIFASILINNYLIDCEDEQNEKSFKFINKLRNEHKKELRNKRMNSRSNMSKLINRIKVDMHEIIIICSLSIFHIIISLENLINKNVLVTVIYISVILLIALYNWRRGSSLINTYFGIISILIICISIWGISIPNIKENIYELYIVSLALSSFSFDIYIAYKSVILFAMILLLNVLSFFFVNRMIKKDE